MFRSRWWSFGFRSTVMLYFVVLIVLPIIGIYTQSFSSGWEPFWSSVSDPLAWKSVLLTVRLSVIATAINVLIGTMIGWVLIRYKFWGRSILNSLVDLPFALPTAVGGLMILLLLGPNSFVGNIAGRLGFEIVFHEPAIVIAMVFVTFLSLSGLCSLCWKRWTNLRKKLPIRWVLRSCEPSFRSFYLQFCRVLSAEGCWHFPDHWPSSAQLCW